MIRAVGSRLPAAESQELGLKPVPISREIFELSIQPRPEARRSIENRILAVGDLSIERLDLFPESR